MLPYLQFDLELQMMWKSPAHDKAGVCVTSALFNNVLKEHIDSVYFSTYYPLIGYQIRANFTLIG